MAVTELPRWDVSSFFPDLDSAAFASAHEALTVGVARLGALYDHHGVRAGDPHPPSIAEVGAFEAVLTATNELYNQMRLVSAFVSSYVSTDARDDRAAALSSRLRSETAPLAVLGSRFNAWVATLGADALAAASPAAADHAWPLAQAERRAAHQMTEAEEGLAAELNLTGGSAWTRLHGDVSSRLTAPVPFPGGRVDVAPITVVRNLAGDPDPAVRRAAFDAELAAWESVAVPLAAALNGIKGEANALNRRRGWEDSLAPALHANAVDRATLDAMQAAVVASFPRFRTYLRAKAGLLGHPAGLPWWDLLAPVRDPSGAAVGWDGATGAVRQAFGSFSPALQALAERAFAERWVDAGARDGKRGGAFCMSVDGDQSRVLMNFAGTFDSVSTLAHELGHAYHNTQLAHRTALQRQTPMALAETASIFCETVLVQQALAGAPPQARLGILDTDLTGATQVVVDIHSRFLFEREVFEQRAASTLSVADLNRLMTDAQVATYGDGLDPSALHPFMWAVKPHYYSTAYYNWPYTFGLLFGLGLYARFREDPERFRAGYDDLLSATGLGSAADLAGRFGIDVRDEAFWASSLAVLADRIEEYVALAGSTRPQGDR